MSRLWTPQEASRPPASIGSVAVGEAVVVGVQTPIQLTMTPTEAKHFIASLAIEIAKAERATMERQAKEAINGDITKELFNGQ